MAMADEVVRRQLRVANPDGLHVRPAARLARVASAYASDIRLVLGDRRLDAKSVFELMSLAAPQGTELLLEVTGSDARAAADAIEQLFAEKSQGEEASPQRSPN